MKGCDTILGCEIETIVLRYRDLSSKNTIKIHNDKIASKGFVWWGWWAKPQEKVALEVFKSLAEKLLVIHILKCFYLIQVEVNLEGHNV